MKNARNISALSAPCLLISVAVSAATARYGALYAESGGSHIRAASKIASFVLLFAYPTLDFYLQKLLELVNLVRD